MQNFLAIDNVCAWPNIKKLPNGEIIAVIFNQPCHLLWEGTIECHVSSNNGNSWQFRSYPVVNEPETSRGNVAVGINSNQIIVLCGGWDKAVPAPAKNIQGNIGNDRIKYKQKEKNVLRPVCSVSKDNGHTWNTVNIKVEGTENVTGWVPYGNIITLKNGNLGCSMYGATGTAFTDSKQLGSFFLESADNGTTWKCLSSIAEDGNETEIIKLPNGNILAAVRKQNLDLYESTNEGKYWRFISPITSRAMYPADFILLNDGYLLLTYGIRKKELYGIGAMKMDLNSQTWSTPVLIADFGDAYDGGYPSNVELDNGKILTAYYCSPNQKQKYYHMGVVVWDKKDFLKENS